MFRTTTGSEAGEPPPNDQDPNLTPPKQGEEQCASFENKLSHHKNDLETRLQLQADMVLTCAIQLTRILDVFRTPEDLENIKILTCYGMAMGPTYDLKLLKLCINFDQGTLIFEELLKVKPCSVYPAYVDIIIQHIFAQLKLNL